MVGVEQESTHVEKVDAGEDKRVDDSENDIGLILDVFESRRRNHDNHEIFQGGVSALVQDL